jgi:hypothetical protein
MVVDALTCNQDEIWRMSLEDSEPWGCTCLAKEDPAVRHSHTCGVRPIYAELFRIYVFTKIHIASTMSYYGQKVA